MDRLSIPSAMPAELAEKLSDIGSELDESFLEAAREKIVETVMLFGEYPPPSRSGLFFTYGSNRPVQFDLQEFLFDEAGKLRVDPVEAEEFFVLAITDYGTSFNECRSRWEKRVTEMLEKHFTDDHDLVREVAEEIAEDYRADHED